MNVLAALFLGLLAGWLLEWAIDWFYLRKKADRLHDESNQCGAQLETLRQQYEDLEAQYSNLSQEYEQLKVETAGMIKPPPDNLESIKGVGKKIARLLNDHGISTFAQLAAMQPDELRALLGDKVKRLADEEDIIKQAHKLAHKKR